MIDIKTTADGDLVFADDDLQTATGAEEVEQSLSFLLRTRKGELFYDADSGLDQTGLFGRGYDTQQIAADIVDCLQQDSRVLTAVVSKAEVKDRTLYVSFSCTLDNGENVESEVIL